MRMRTPVPPSPEFEAVARGALFRDRVVVPVKAAPDDIFRALEEAPLSEKKLAWVVGELRYFPTPQRRCLSAVHSEASRFSALKSGSTLVLLNDAPREIILASAGCLRSFVDQTPVWFDSRDEFEAFDHPEHQKLFISIRVAATGRPGTHWLVLEHATQPLSPAAERRFKRNWNVIRQMSAFLSRELLRELARQAARASVRNSSHRGEAVHAHLLSA